MKRSHVTYVWECVVPKAPQKQQHNQASPLPNHELGSVKEAAERYGCSPDTVRRWVAQGMLDAYRLGPRLLRIDLTADDRLLRRIQTRRGSR